jgi:hypothetical protein
LRTKEKIEETERGQDIQWSGHVLVHGATNLKQMGGSKWHKISTITIGDGTKGRRSDECVDEDETVHGSSPSHSSCYPH